MYLERASLRGCAWECCSSTCSNRFCCCCDFVVLLPSRIDLESVLSSPTLVESAGAPLEKSCKRVAAGINAVKDPEVGADCCPSGVFAGLCSLVAVLADDNVDVEASACVCVGAVVVVGVGAEVSATMLSSDDVLWCC